MALCETPAAAASSRILSKKAGNPSASRPHSAAGAGEAASAAKKPKLWQIRAKRRGKAISDCVIDVLKREFLGRILTSHRAVRNRFMA
jgi:hypothetical protein